MSLSEANAHTSQAKLTDVGPCTVQWLDNKIDAYQASFPVAYLINGIPKGELIKATIGYNIWDQTMGDCRAKRSAYVLVCNRTKDCIVHPSK